MELVLTTTIDCLTKVTLSSSFICQIIHVDSMGRMDWTATFVPSTQFVYLAQVFVLVCSQTYLSPFLPTALPFGRIVPGIPMQEACQYQNKLDITSPLLIVQRPKEFPDALKNYSEQEPILDWFQRNQQMVIFPCSYEGCSKCIEMSRWAGMRRNYPPLASLIMACRRKASCC